ncbi:FeoA family protein [Idiomarina xiamenensis]|uniref:Ferrous iron transporter FeoA-like domain-containing protein n=1 Tax=Idiomarina xiamenensis 10-D-4 TaxID=740709 RepID=K2KJX3_9GAMM|nr:FeoA family protein [Idiomarina xiamenensis]EKE82904.1 hypothetical protein A10D4_08694 [Idiomarina xiamenensis 10-D-4]
MTLWEMKAKQQALIHSLSAKLSPAVAGRLHEMGFNAGQAILCLRRSPLRGPLVVQVGDCVYSLEQEVAQAVLLEQSAAS